MPSSTGPINGNLMFLYLDGVKVQTATNITISGTAEMIDVTSQDSAGARDIIPGLRSWNGSADLIVDMSKKLNAKEISIAMKAGTKYTVKLIQMTSSGTHIHGDGYWHGDMYITGYTVTAGANDKVTYNFTFDGDGDLICSLYT